MAVTSQVAYSKWFEFECVVINRNNGEVILREYFYETYVSI